MAGNNSVPAPIGPWTNDNLQATAQASAGVGAEDGLPDQVRFLANVAKHIRRRVAQPGAQNDPVIPAVFLLRPNPNGLNLPTPPKRVPMLDNGLTPLAGRLWMLGAGPASGHYSDYTFVDDDGLFNLIIEGLAQGSCPAMLFDPRPTVPEVRFYPQGLAKPDEYQSISIATETIDLTRVLDAVDVIYKASLITPEAQPPGGGLWQDQQKWWPKQNAEALVQLNLKAGLAGAFPTCTIRHEQTMPEGRLDLEIEQSDPVDRSKVTRHAILELKVLRSFGETGTAYSVAFTEAWVESGIEQAAAYRDSKGAKWSALFCFDMRKDISDQACFNHVLQKAASLQVALRCWHLFATSKLYRTNLVGAA
jgi:hypothetical protein